LQTNPDDRAARNALADYLQEQGELPHPIAYRVAGADDEGECDPEPLRAFLADPFAGLVRALVVGFCFGDYETSSEGAVRDLIAARERLPHLRALFLGDIVQWESEISWIRHSDLTPLLAAFPELEHFRSRGGEGLGLSAFEHPNLKSLAFEASNLPSAVVRAVGASTLPKLEHLELWLGTARYGANTTPADLAGILEGKGLPALRYLGFCNSDISDDVAVAVAGSPILERLRVLDFSLGTLGDRGAEALLANPALARLERLDIRHHFVSPGVIERLRALGIQVDASGSLEAEGPDERDRYVAHSE
jgi:hypothetical protein